MDILAYLLAKKYASNITTAKLASKAVTVEKLADGIVSKKATALPETVGGVSVLDEQTEYYIGTQTAINIAFPTTATNGDYCFVCFTAGTSASLTITGDCVGDTSITLEETKTYEVLATYNGTNWTVSYISY